MIPATARPESVAAINGQIARVDAELERTFDRIVPGMGKARSLAVHARLGALRTERLSLVARRRVADVDQRYREARLLDRLERGR